MGAFAFGSAAFVTMTSGRSVIAVRTSAVGVADAIRVTCVVAMARRAGMSTVVTALAAGAMFAVTMFGLTALALTMFGLAIPTLTVLAAMAALMTRTIRRTRLVLAVGDAEPCGAFSCWVAGEGSGIVGAALRTVAAAVVRMAVGTIASRMFGTVPVGSALESRTATVAFATTSSAWALAARSVVVTTAFRHRQSFAADIVDHDERLFHHPLDGADFATL